MSKPKKPDWWRCCACERKITDGSRPIYIPYFRVKRTSGSTGIGVCPSCRRRRRPGETGRALCRRLDATFGEAWERKKAAQRPARVYPLLEAISDSMTALAAVRTLAQRRRVAGILTARLLRMFPKQLRSQP